jgi:hypothetical protein
MSVQGLAGHAPFPAEIANVRAALSHSRHGEPYVGGHHLERRAARAAPGPCRGEASLGALGDQRTLEFRQRGNMPNTSLPAGVVVSIDAP